MVDWKYVLVYIFILAAQLVAINVVSVLIGLLAYIKIVIGSGVFVVEVLIESQPGIPMVVDVGIIYFVLINIHVLLFILLWIVAVLSTSIGILLSIFALFEVVGDEILAFKHPCDDPPAIGSMKGRWEMVAAAVVRSSITGLLTPQFRGAIVCDEITTSNSNDPFYPEHMSVVYLVENRCRNFLWTEIIIWRVSMLSGAQTPVARKQFAALDSCHLEWCFESRGVLFVIVQGAFLPQPGSIFVLFIYDTSNGGKCAQFELPNNMVRGRIASITCLQRLFNPDGKVNGWRIRLVAIRGHWHTPPHLAKYEMDLHEGADVLVNVTMSTMPLDNFMGSPFPKAVRTSDGMFGALDDNGVMLYDPACNVCVYFADLAELSRFDKSCAAYYGHHDFIWDDDIFAWYVCPIVLNDRECIVTTGDGKIYRMEIKPATLRYTAVKRIFRADPSLKSKINAAQFHQVTGIARMDDQFES